MRTAGPGTPPREVRATERRYLLAELARAVADTGRRYDPERCRTLAATRELSATARSLLCALAAGEPPPAEVLPDTGSAFRVGMRVRFAVNLPELSLFNGMESTLTAIRRVHVGQSAVSLDSVEEVWEEDPTAVTYFTFKGGDVGEAREVPCCGKAARKKGLSRGSLFPATAQTIDTAQGGEWEHVFVLMARACPVMTWRRAYVAFGRARRRLTLILVDGALSTIRNDVERCTALAGNLPRLDAV